MTEDNCRRRAELLIGAMAKTQDVQDRRRLIDMAMRWHNSAMVAHDRELSSPRSSFVERRERVGGEALIALRPAVGF